MAGSHSSTLATRVLEAPLHAAGLAEIPIINRVGAEPRGHPTRRAMLGRVAQGWCLEKLAFGLGTSACRDVMAILGTTAITWSL